MEKYDKELEKLNSKINENEYIEKIEKHLKNGGDIDVKISFNDNVLQNRCTILHSSISLNLQEIVDYVISKGANICEKIEMKDYRVSEGMWSALEVAILNSNFNSKIYDLVAKKRLKLYSFFELYS